MYKSIAGIAALALSLTALAQQTVTCTSTKTRSRLCPANTHKGVVLLEERSDNLCDQGRTWIVSTRGITVKGGCSAVFQLGGVANGYGNGTNEGNGGGTAYGSSGTGANGSNGAYVANNNGQNQNNNNGYPQNNNNGQPQNNNGYPQNNNNGQPQNNNGYQQNNNNGYPQNNNNGQPQNNNNGYPQNGTGNGNSNGNQPGYNNSDNQNRNSSAQDRDRSSSNRGYGDARREGLVLPAGTRMDVRLEQTVNSSSVNQGDMVAGTLVSDLIINGQTVAPAGTAVQAKIASAQGSPLDLRLDSITIQGQSYPLATNSVHSVRDSTSTPTAGKESTGQQIGAILGAIGGGTELPRGSVYSFRLASAARVGQAR